MNTAHASSKGGAPRTQFRVPRKRVVFSTAIGVFFIVALWGLLRTHHRQEHHHAEHASFRVEPAGDYFAVKFDALEDESHGLQLSDLRIPSQGTCEDYARGVEEPMSPQYAPRLAVPALGNNAPRAFWRWPGQISKEAFDRAAAKEWPGCVHCMDVVPYKIIGGRLYVHRRARNCGHREIAEEMLKVVLYLFPIPDMEFLLHFGDGCTVGLPVISWNVCRQHPDAGFTMPSYSVWEKSLGPQQMRAHHTCLRHRYPVSRRQPLAVWRGSTTDTQFTNFNKDNYLQALRVRLHLLARNHTDVLDVRISNPLNCDDFVRQRLPGTGGGLAFEDYNKYCLVVDVDGNGWSDRFGQLVHFYTPILKVASNFTGFFEHLYAPDVAIAQFSRDLSDLPAKARKMVEECATTRALLDHVGIAEGFAYTLLTYHSLSAWAVQANLTDYNEVNMLGCCKFANLPKEFAAAVSARLVPQSGKASAGGAGAAAGRKGLKP
ncbi:hypothetical protein GPECTOR_8g398 [Gonium pectorale]|uniref:Glycosyl transferase CAP10 domain-containing protein n=1 Tax=Gonium pectorale TaxID=33097 RepID=A0A150GTA0_GONPE|nr:hypothetical protein GPECTOR_8g398 [Gonium pectorale]|eukprot:KXZ53031.1 hypothetical protein GPECTOR_8g398 [Gonium pectorale]